MKFRTNQITGISPWYSGSEREHQQIFKAIVHQGDVCVDIGANWGLHSLYLSSLVQADGLIVSIEPFPPAFAELVWHVQANACKNVTTLPLAISDKDGDGLFVPASSASEGALSGLSSESSNEEDSIFVVTRTLDSIVQELDLESLKLVKIDVEGAEGKVLSGAQHTIERFRPHFVIDLHTPKQDVLVAEVLTNCEYKLSRLSGPPIVRTDVGWPHRFGVWGSIVAFPKTST